MTLREPTSPEAVLVAIDVSKLRNDVLIEIPGKTRRRHLVVPNTKPEHDRFVELLRGLDKPVVAGFEATGNYHRPLAFRLLEEGIALRLVSSVALARTREALHNGWDKNDPKDAQVILHMLRIGATQTYLDPIQAGINDIQELSKTHEIDIEGQDRTLASAADTLPAALLPRGCTLRRQLPQRLVPGFPRTVPDACQHHGACQGRVYRSGLGRGRQEGLESPIAGRYLRDRPVVDWPACRDG